MLHIIRHGHSFVEIETEKGSILIDPFITDNPKCDVTVEDMIAKNIIAICLTHGHEDHVGNALDIARAKQVPIVCEYGMAKWIRVVQRWENVIVGSVGGKIVVDDDLMVTFCLAIHGGNIMDAVGYQTIACGLLLDCHGKKIYHAGDTALTMDMQLLANKHIDVACLPIGDTYTMGVEDAAIAATWIKPTIVFPIHFDTRPKIRVDAVDFARRVMAAGPTVPKVLTPGQYVVLE